MLGDALRTSSALTRLELTFLNLWGDLAAAETLLRSLAGHPTLRVLSLLADDITEDGHPRRELAACRARAGAALGALVAANAPALLELVLSMCSLRGAGLAAPVFDALPRNTHLVTLRCDGNDLDAAFVHERLLPAVRSNASLR